MRGSYVDIISKFYVDDLLIPVKWNNSDWKQWTQLKLAHVKKDSQ